MGVLLTLCAGAFVALLAVWTMWRFPRTPSTRDDEK